MSALDTVKELGRMATTATLSKDVIDLFSQKVALLEKQVATLEQENAALKSEKTNLEKKVVDLEQELARLSPKSDRLEEGAEKLLQLLFHHDDMTSGRAAQLMGILEGMAEYYQGVLIERGFAMWIGVGIVTDWGESQASIAITHDGRAYCVRHGLAK